MFRVIIFSLFFITFNCFANSISFIICPKGKVKYGDSYEKFVDYCGKPSFWQGGMKPIGKNNIPMPFKTFIKKYPDGSKVRVLFLDEKIAFIFDL